MIRKIIQIEEAACNGCGACAAACHEGAIQMVNGKAKLMRLLRRFGGLPAGVPDRGDPVCGAGGARL